MFLAMSIMVHYADKSASGSDNSDSDSPDSNEWETCSSSSLEYSDNHLSSSSDSDSNNDQSNATTAEPKLETKGYQFEPRRSSLPRSSSSSSSNEPASSASEDEGASACVGGAVAARMTDPERPWCKCENCQRMPTLTECVCCTELKDIKEILASENISRYPHTLVKIQLHR